MTVKRLWGSSAPYAPYASVIACSHFVLHKILDVAGAKEQVDWLYVQTQFEALVTNEESSGEEEAISFESVLGSATDELETKLSKARLYAQRLGTTAASSPEGHIFINGKYHVANDVCCRTFIYDAISNCGGIRIF